MPYEYRTFSECGPRWKNEDTLEVVEMPEQGRTLFILCDGMGGHRMGDLVSRTVVKAFRNYWKGNPKRKDSEKKILDAAGQAIVALNKHSLCRMGTTMVLAAIENGRLLFAHCGDSRLYFYKPGASEVLRTKDHVEVTPEGWEYVSKGFVQGEECHVPETGSAELHTGDVFMLCSDGVYKAFKDEELEVLLRSEKDMDVLAGRIKEYCDTHTRDNYSAILVKVIEHPSDDAL